MAATAGFALTLSLLLPQGTSSQGEERSYPSVLTEREQQSLNKKLADWFEARTEYDFADTRRRERAARKEQRAKEIFLKEWESRTEKEGDLLKYTGDLLAIFDKVFAYERERGTNTVKKEGSKGDIPEYSLYVPRSYKPDRSMPAVLLIPGFEDGEWVDAREWFESTWEDSASAETTIFHIPTIGEEIDLDPKPDFSKQGEDEKEVARIGAALRSFGESQRRYRFDRQRVYLDCGKGSCAFGLRLASNFPDRFAAIILRAPTDVGDLRLGSLTGLPVMLVQTEDNKDVCQKLQAALNELEEGQCEILEATDEYPFKAAQGELDQWLASKERNLYRSKVVVEPNDDRFRKGYWVDIGRADQIHTTAPANRPRIEVVADKATNRITVETRGIEDFRLVLNDELVDLDKEFTVVINDKAYTEKRIRNLNFLVDLVRMKFDTNWLFTTEFSAAVPKTESDGNGNGGGQKD